MSVTVTHALHQNFLKSTKEGKYLIKVKNRSITIFDMLLSVEMALPKVRASFEYI